MADQAAGHAHGARHIRKGTIQHSKLPSAAGDRPQDEDLWQFLKSHADAFEQVRLRPDQEACLQGGWLSRQVVMQHLPAGMCDGPGFGGGGAG